MQDEEFSEDLFLGSYINKILGMNIGIYSYVAIITYFKLRI